MCAGSLWFACSLDGDHFHFGRCRAIQYPGFGAIHLLFSTVRVSRLVGSGQGLA